MIHCRAPGTGRYRSVENIFSVGRVFNKAFARCTSGCAGRFIAEWSARPPGFVEIQTSFDITVIININEYELWLKHHFNL